MAKRKPQLEEPRPWERQEGESAAAWEAFLAYLDAGDKRSVRAVAQKLNKSASLVGRWSSAWKWQERIRAYENDLQKQAHAEAVKGLQEMNRRHINIAMKMQKAALEALEGLDVKGMSAKDIKEIFKMATELERLTRQSAIGAMKEKEAESEVEKETVHIYIPDNGRSGGE